MAKIRLQTNILMELIINQPPGLIDPTFEVTLIDQGTGKSVKGMGTGFFIAMDDGAVKLVKKLKDEGDIP